VLAVGNVMNEGTVKGGAQGITVDSLLKLTQTKSVCKRMTVLDYIVESLLAKWPRDQDGAVDLDASANASALNASVLHAAAGGHDDLCPLDFFLDLPDLDDATRLPMGEISGTVAALGQALEGAKRELKKVEEEAAAATKAQTKKRRVVGVTTTATTAHNLAAAPAAPALDASTLALSPRSALMAAMKARAAARDHKAAASVAEADGSEVPVGRNLAASLSDEAAAASSTKAAADAAGLRATSALAADPRAGLMAALNARRGDDGQEPLTSPAAPVEAVVATEAVAESMGEEGELVRAAASGAAALRQFVAVASERVASLADMLQQTKAKTEALGLFFGEKGQDAGHIFECLRQFAAMTREATAKVCRS
jgi:hypothetical protein